MVILFCGLILSSPKALTTAWPSEHPCSRAACRMMELNCRFWITTEPKLDTKKSYGPNNFMELCMMSLRQQGSMHKSQSGKHRTIAPRRHEHPIAISHGLLRQVLRMPRPFRGHQRAFIGNHLQLGPQAARLVALCRWIKYEPDTHAQNVPPRNATVENRSR